MAGPSAERCPQSALVDPEPVVHHAVDDDDGNVLGPLGGQRLVAADVLLDPADAELPGDPCDLAAGVRTEMTARLGEDPNAGLGGHADRSFPFATFPVTEWGSSATTSTDVGHLNRASRAAAYSTTESWLSSAPARGTTRARTVSPV